MIFPRFFVHRLPRSRESLRCVLLFRCSESAVSRIFFEVTSTRGTIPFLPLTPCLAPLVSLARTRTRDSPFFALCSRSVLRDFEARGNNVNGLTLNVSLNNVLDWIAQRAAAVGVSGSMVSLYPVLSPIAEGVHVFRELRKRGSHVISWSEQSPSAWPTR